MALTLINRVTPSMVPLVMASMALPGAAGRVIGAPPADGASPGTISRATMIAAGALISEAASTCPMASGMTGARMAA